MKKEDVKEEKNVHEGVEWWVEDREIQFNFDVNKVSINSLMQWQKKILYVVASRVSRWLYID